MVAMLSRTIMATSVFSGLYTLLDYILAGITVVGVFFVILGVIEVVVAISQGTRDLPSMKNAIFAISAGLVCISLQIIINAMGVTW